MNNFRFVPFLLAFMFSGAATANEVIPSNLNEKLDQTGKEASLIASMPEVRDAVKAYNSKTSESYNKFADQYSKMTSEKWKALSPNDPIVRNLSKSPLMKAVSAKVSALNKPISEVFISGADGGKVGFLSKTTSWNHKGKPKHDDPMQGKFWKGKPELDESTGKHQVQVSVPVLDENQKPIGSLVIGVDLVRL
jgi:sensor histidine kinase regulating citrate/malate metabolism